MSYSNDMHHSVLRPRFAAAFHKLRMMGVPVFENPEDGTFGIDAKAPGADIWVDYYGNAHRQELVFGVHLEIEKILQRLGLYAGWVNPNRLLVCED